MSNSVTPNSSVADMPDRSLLMDRSVSGRRAIEMPDADVPLSEIPDGACYANLTICDCQRFRSWM